MHQSQKVITIVLMAALILATFSAALAAPAAQGLLPCSADPVTGKVAGTVVVVDGENGVVTVEQADGTQCTVDISVDETHPIALLLGLYFGDINSETFQAALEDTKGCATQDPATQAWSWVDCGTNPPNAKVTAVTVNPDGSYTYTVVVQGATPQSFTFTTTDQATIDQLNGALATLTDLPLEADGSLKTVSDLVMEYHNEGMGFGVLVKLFALSDTTGIPVEELKTEFQSGVGMGQLFKEYGGKPNLLGVGHVRQALKNGDETTAPGNGIGNGQGNGNTPPGLEKKANKPPKENGNKLKGTNHGVPKGNGKGGGHKP